MSSQVGKRQNWNLSFASWGIRVGKKFPRASGIAHSTFVLKNSFKWHKRRGIPTNLTKCITKLKRLHAMDSKVLEFEMHSLIGSLFFKFYFWVKYTSGQLMPTKMSSEKSESIQIWGCSHQTLMKGEWSHLKFLPNLSYHSIIFVPVNFLIPLRPIFWEGLVFLLIALFPQASL